MKKETTLAPRTWHSGPPPHVGWWNASNARWTGQWRWWDGVQWSDWAGPSYTAKDARAAVLRLDYDGGIEWSDYYPEGARVPRVNPADPYITPLLPKLNAGDMGTWVLAGQLTEYNAPGAKTLALDALRAASRPYAPLDMHIPAAYNIGESTVYAVDVSAQPPTPEEDEAWRAISTGQRTGPAAQNPGARDLAEVSTRDLMKEIFRRIG